MENKRKISTIKSTQNLTFHFCHRETFLVLYLEVSRNNALKDHLEFFRQAILLELSNNFLTLEN